MLAVQQNETKPTEPLRSHSADGMAGAVPPKVLGSSFPTLPKSEDQQRLHCTCSGGNAFECGNSSG